MLYLPHKLVFYKGLHSLKSFRIWNVSDPYFPVFSGNTRKYKHENNPNWRTFHAVLQLFDKRS